MTPYYQDEYVQIYLADNRELLDQLPACDLLLTDPPYGHGDRWNGGTWAANPMYAEALKWDAQKADDKTLAAWIAKATTAIIWGGNYYTLPPSRCWLAWEKSSKMPTMADFEMAWTNRVAPAKQWREDRNPDGKREHPTQKPLSLMQWCLSLVPDARTIIDPWMGSGTTLVAAKERRKSAIGVETSEKYCAIAAKRLSQEVLAL